MSGTGASNLGYGNIAPGSNINGRYVNIDNSHDSGGFGTNQIPGFPGLSGAKYNVDAAAGRDPGICIWKGGKKLKKKIKNITKMYKMKGSKRKRSTLKRKLKSRIKKGGFYKVGGKTRRRNSSKKMRGGYAQFENNMPLTPVYSTGGILTVNQSALANPTPYSRLSNCVNCEDNYNHYTGKGFPSRGH